MLLKYGLHVIVFDVRKEEVEWSIQEKKDCKGK